MKLAQPFSHCPSCGRCWACVKPHTVMVDDHSGVGVLCSGCWDRLAHEDRLQFHFEHWLKHATVWERFLAFFEYPVSTWEKLKQAIECDHAREWTGYCQACGEFHKVRGPVDSFARCPVCEHRLQERMRLG